MLKEKQLPAGLAPFENVPSSLVRAANQTQALPSALGLGSSRKLSSTTSQSNRKRKGRGKRPKIMDEPYAGLTEEQWTARVIQARSRLEDILSHPTFRKRQEGKQRRPRGIVIPAGGNVLLTNAFMVISVLREMHRCTLPIEVFYNGAREMDEKTNHYFESRFKNVTLFDLSTAPYPSHHRRIPIDHYTFKAYAFYHSSFDQVLLLDADSIPLRDPEYLYDTPQFLEAGHLNWPDWWYDNLPGFGWPLEAYALFGLAPPQMGPHVLQGSEAGQTLLDRRRHWEVLEWYWFANTHGPDGLYKWMWYDKEALQLAFSLAGRADLYHQVTRYPREALCKGPATLREYAHVGILQHDPYGRPAFLHQAGSLQKFDPSKDFPYQPNFVSVPLNQLRAIKLFPDAGAQPKVQGI
ncbi:hypothetical protein WJX72_005712 [[Myrmecia] bisecta]|uniref:Uncharacterized protein n=1 Tax=[Myrmecia] bisecta TaxID=41462 RepID=A0AAW1QBN2_9CHLO